MNLINPLGYLLEYTNLVYVLGSLFGSLDLMIIGMFPGNPLGYLIDSI